MRRNSQVICDTPDNPGCKLVAEVSWVCSVEGSEVTLCRPCDDLWKNFARGKPDLMVRCPNCSKVHPVAAAPAPGATSDLLGDYMRNAVEKAMHRAGVLKDQRDAVIRILDTDMSIWAEAEARAGAHASG